MNTPPVFQVYVAGLALKWLKEKGGVAGIEALNQEKSKLLYDCLAESKNFESKVDPDSRSIMQISTYLAGRGINIENLVNKAKDKYAYTMIDIDEIDQATQDKVVPNLEQIPAVTRVRILTHKK
ncbi:hypothetical protein BTH58_06270 [Lactobacillus delbrueckii subsp. bulgaricus]|nr:hypothetical protein [Lactobacillus delbrueckii subsp. bulgaricus]MBT8889192.1 hypothetical protein [Lactobacillus delbrueckii subsp. bulgaricus]